jgi:polysaccharide export outer membrane protein
MKPKLIRFDGLALLLLSGLLALGLAGCASTDDPGVMNPPSAGPNSGVLPRLTIGDSILVTMADIPDAPPPEEKAIKEDGTISMPQLGRIQAAGKTPGELEDYIHGLYVPSIYTHLTVTIKMANDRVYFVRGEVHNPNRLIYVGPITVTKAITSAGDFTDFANRNRVYLIRASGQRFKLDCDKILSGEAPDPPVYPGDQIEVKRRLL